MLGTITLVFIILEESMKKAHEDTELLKSIVLPLEEQIVALKGKLRETDSLLQEYERREARSLVEMEAVAGWLEGKDREKLVEKIKEAVEEGERDEGGNRRPGCTYLPFGGFPVRHQCILQGCASRGWRWGQHFNAYEYILRPPPKLMCGEGAPQHGPKRHWVRFWGLRWPLGGPSSTIIPDNTRGCKIASLRL